MALPTIAVSMGDPAGIGPELVIKVLSDSSVYRRCRPVVVGDEGTLRDACRSFDAQPQIRLIDRIDKNSGSPLVIDVIRPEDLDISATRPGELSAAAGHAAARCLTTAFNLAMNGEVQGVVLAPMNKQAFHLAGYDDVDELEYLSKLVGGADPVLLGAVHPTLWTVAVTAHIPFRSIADRLTVDSIVRHIHLLHDVLQKVGAGDRPIAVAALNVHAGEGGLFGREEIDVIAPAIEAARCAGLAVEGPVPADTVFVRARDGDFAGVVCMYHDQANIARKLLATRSGATIFLGLPVVCATTAHGTAFDIVGQGVADPGSLRAALNYAAVLAPPPTS
jgi:4-hydroxythreonine-4-phosphate dehydrogenase